jgi:phosphonate transport system permease protein
VERIVPPRPPRTWRDSLAAGLAWIGIALLAVFIWRSLVDTGFNLYELKEGAPRIHGVLSDLVRPDLSWNATGSDGAVKLNPQTGRPQPGTLRLLLSAMWMTLMIGFLATVLSIGFSFVLAFPAARNLTRGTPLSRGGFVVARGLLNTLRAIEPIVLGIIFIVVVGPGPFAGVLALALHSVGSLGKLFAEAIEQAEPLPVEAVRATGASNFLTVWYGVLPQVAPQMLAFSLYRWDMNTRMGIVLGIVGAGGIGFYLNQYIQIWKYHQISTALLIILVVVSALDWASGYLREKLG